ncbi:hypothetical protein Pssp01_61970 [Pseudomonas sp. NBRC 100443]|nr:hypothetical protein Pssp01_61970 [Pseudomonas sp. NBRC 100443]
MSGRGVRPQQGDDGGDQQDGATDGFDMQETFKVGEGAFGHSLGTGQGILLHAHKLSARRPDLRIDLSRHPCSRHPERKSTGPFRGE